MGDTEFRLKWPKVVLFGDSLTQRSFEPRDGLWGALLADRLQRVADVVPRGFSGYNSRMCRIILPRIFSTNNVADIVAFVICLGSNDSSSKEAQNYVPLDEYQENMVFIVNYLKSIGLSNEKILLVTPPPYHHESYIAYCIEVGRQVPETAKSVSKYAKACLDISRICDVEVVDLYSEMLKDENWKRYLIDGLHFSHAGSVRLYTMILPHISKKVNIDRMILPPWNEFNLQEQEEMTPVKLCN